MNDLTELQRLTKKLNEEIKALNDNNFVPIDQLRTLVFTTYMCNMISVSRGSELLKINIEDFRIQFKNWLNLYPELQQLEQLANMQNFNYENLET